MKRILRFSTLAGALAAAALLAPVLQSDVCAGPLYGGGYEYNGGYGSVYGGNSGYGYNTYGYGRSGYGAAAYRGAGYGRGGYGGYTYVAPREYVYPTYGSYGLGNGFGTGGTYRGMIAPEYGGSRFYGQPYRPAYSPYGYGGYGPYGY